MINFFTFKWGELYDYNYPNRLYYSLKKHCKQPFAFTCITDDWNGIDQDIHIIDYNTFDPFDYPKDRVFTREKLILMDRFQEGQNYWVDLDILIHNDIEELLKPLDAPTFIWNHWSIEDKKDPYKWYGKGSMCYVNSSFVGWNDSNGQFLYQFLYDNAEKLFYTYKSLDKMLFYQMERKGLMNYWPKGLFYNYNFQSNPREYNDNAIACLFNTSHLRNTNTIKDELELHETIDWAKEIWESYA